MIGSPQVRGHEASLHRGFVDPGSSSTPIGPRIDGREPDADYRAIVTVIGAFRTTVSATLPTTIRESPERP